MQHTVESLQLQAHFAHRDARDILRGPAKTRALATAYELSAQLYEAQGKMPEAAFYRTNALHGLTTGWFSAIDELAKEEQV